MTPSEASVAVRSINGLIREGKELTDSILFDVLGCIYLVNLYQMVIEMKNDVMDSLIVNDAPLSFMFDDIQVDGEGFVFVPHGIAGNANNPLNEVTRIVGRYKDHDIASSWLLTVCQLEIQNGHFHAVSHLID